MRYRHMNMHVPFTGYIQKTEAKTPEPGICHHKLLALKAHIPSAQTIQELL